MAWEAIKNKQCKYERVGIILFAVCIICGLIGDCIVKHGRYLISVAGMDGISLVILQIQGTIDTLSIAVLSLLGGRVSETYMGIPLIDFTLNRKPLYLKQKWITNLLIGLLCVNIFLHLFGLYNTVLALFMVTAGLIIISIKETYEVFSGHIVVEDEIKSYLADHAENGTHSDHLDLMQKFCDEWKRKIASQTEPEYETYRQVFDILFKKIFQDETPDSRQELQRYIYPSIHALLCAELPSSRRRGLSFLRKIYHNAWACILETKDRDTVQKFPDGFHLFHAVCYHLQEVVADLPIAETEKDLDWFTTAEYIFLLNYWIAADGKGQDELRDAVRFSGAMGHYLAKNRSQNWSAPKWEKPLGWLRLPHCPPDKTGEIAQWWPEMLFCYAVSLVNSNMLDLLENSLYIKAVQTLYFPIENWKAFLILRIHCYIYYLAEYETTACISEDLQKSCKDFLRSYKIRRIFSEFLRRISYSTEIFTWDLEKRLTDGLTRFELLPREGMSKQMVMESVVYDFVVFITLYLYEEYDPNHMMERIFSNEFVKFNLTEYIKTSEKVIKRLDTFLMLLSTTEILEADLTQKKARAKYTTLERMTKQRLKVILMEEAMNRPQKVGRTSLEEVEQQIKQYIDEKFALIQSEEAKSGPECRIRCFRLDSIADMLAEDYLSNYLGDIADGMLYGLCQHLIETGSLQKIYRDDIDYIEYITNSDAGTVLGSRQMFMAQQYSDQQVLDQYLEKRKTAFIGYQGIGMLLKENSLWIHVEKVHISVRPTRIKESGAQYDPEHDEYKYNTWGTALIYKREELADYLKRSRKMIHVTIRLSIKRVAGTIGAVLCADRK